MSDSSIKPGQVLAGPQFNEPMRVETVRANGPDSWVTGLVGVKSDRFRSVTLTRRAGGTTVRAHIGSRSFI